MPSSQTIQQALPIFSSTKNTALPVELKTSSNNFNQVLKNEVVNKSKKTSVEQSKYNPAPNVKSNPTPSTTQIKPTEHEDDAEIKDTNKEEVADQAEHTTGNLSDPGSMLAFVSNVSALAQAANNDIASDRNNTDITSITLAVGNDVTSSSMNDVEQNNNVNSNGLNAADINGDAPLIDEINPSNSSMSSQSNAINAQRDISSPAQTTEVVKFSDVRLQTQPSSQENRETPSAIQSPPNQPEIGIDKQLAKSLNSQKVNQQSLSNTVNRQENSALTVQQTNAAALTSMEASTRPIDARLSNSAETKVSLQQTPSIAISPQENTALKVQQVPTSSLVSKEVSTRPIDARLSHSAGTQVSTINSNNSLPISNSTNNSGLNESDLIPILPAISETKSHLGQLAPNLANTTQDPAVNLLSPAPLKSAPANSTSQDLSLKNQANLTSPDLTDPASEQITASKNLNNMFAVNTQQSQMPPQSNSMPSIPKSDRLGQEKNRNGDMRINSAPLAQGLPVSEDLPRKNDLPTTEMHELTAPENLHKSEEVAQNAQEISSSIQLDKGQFAKELSTQLTQERLDILKSLKVESHNEQTLNIDRTEQVTGTPVPAAPSEIVNTTAISEHISPRVANKGWDQALGQKIVWMVAGGEQSAQLTLNPPDLGPLQVVLSISDNFVDASFVSSHLDVREAIEAAAPKLREMMDNAGISLSGFSVSAETAQSGNPFSGERFQHNSGSQLREIRAGSDEQNMNSTNPAPLTNNSRDSGIVDTFA
ncbi:flagellar hook-length control protein FliK [Undibacterium sp. Ji22W]|uniref:flagellar hook-length control protein FliK n=1 Tax=Undibacterium sp. Ji22W TaxID=3413038 RepID=UPI003BF27817